MGLDLVELMMVVEDTFGVPIPDADAGLISTVGELYDYVAVRAGSRGSGAGACATTAAFLELRRAAMRGLLVERAALRPSTPLAAIVGPLRGRRRRWGAMALHTRSRLRGLGFGYALPARTLGELARIHARDHYAAWIRDHGWRAAEAWSMLRAVVADELGVGLDRVTRDAHFVRDLRAG